MKHIVKLINNEIDKVNSNIKKVNKCFDLCYSCLTSIDIMFSMPDKAPVSHFRNDFKGEMVKKIDYVDAIKGYFESNSDEPQVKIALQYIEDIKIAMKKAFFSELLFINRVSNVAKNNLEVLNKLLEKLEKYDSNTFITKEELEIINSLIGDDINEDLLSEIIEIGKNNAVISVIKKNAESISIDIDDYNDELFVEMEKERSINNISNSFYSSIEKYLYNLGLVEIIVQDANLVNAISNIFKQAIMSKGNISNDDLELCDLMKKEFKNIDLDSIYALTCSVSFALLEVLETNNKELVADIITKYNNIQMSKKEEMNNLSIIKKLLSEINNVRKKYYDEEKYLNFCSSYEGLTEAEIVKTVGMAKYSKMCITKILYENAEILKKPDIDSLNEILGQINSIIERSEFIQEEDTPEKTDSEQVDLSDVKNFIVILSEDKIRENMEEIMLSHNEVNISLFSKAIGKLLFILHEELYGRKTCKPIMDSYNCPNSYEIREERAGIIRIGFKSINTNDGRVVYEVLGFAYGSCDGKEKSDNLRACVKEYESNIEEYRELEKKIKAGTVAQNQKILTEGLTFYNKLLEEQKKTGCDTL